MSERWDYCRTLFEDNACVFLDEPGSCAIRNTPEHCKRCHDECKAAKMEKKGGSCENRHYKNDLEA